MRSAHDVIFGDEHCRESGTIAAIGLDGVELFAIYR